MIRVLLVKSISTSKAQFILCGNPLRGRVINFSTTVLGLKLENYGVYNATKAAVETLTIIMAKEMRGRNINVYAVAPGPTTTELFL